MTLARHPTFGRILVRVVLSEPRLQPVPKPFQRLYAPEESLHSVAWDAWTHVAPFLNGGTRRHYEPALYHGATRVAELGATIGTVGDLLNLPDQHTLGTVQLVMRCQEGS